MTSIDTNKLLQEMRSMAQQAGIDRAIGLPKTGLPSGPGGTLGVNGVQGFGSLMTNVLRDVNAQQIQASQLQQRVEMGDRSVSLVQAMIASQKSNIALQATVQVRNRVVSAYQDIFNMPI